MAHTWEEIEIRSSAFEHNGFIPRAYTGRGEDCSPPLEIIGLSSKCRSVAVVMNDVDHPLIREYNHWLIWNLPPQACIPGDIPHGAAVEELGGAVQGVGYGKHRYRGPKPPLFIRGPHRYQFHVYVLDCKIQLDENAGKKELMQAIGGHILQHGSIIGKFKNGK